MKDLTCKTCGEPRDLGRRVCKKCRAKEVRDKYKETGRYNYGKGRCKRCNTEITLWRKDQIFCRECSFASTSSFGNVENKYERGHLKSYCFMHRRVAEEVLGRELGRNECCHHLDENPENNIFENLIVMARSYHSKLHVYLRKAYANLPNKEKWEELRISITNSWIKSTGYAVVRLSNYKPG